MILLALGLLGLAIADLVRWSPEENPRWLLSALAGAATVTLSAWLAGMSTVLVVGAGIAAFALLLLWLKADEWVEAEPEHKADPNPMAVWPLLAVIVLLVALFAASGSVDPVAGRLGDWYENLPFSFVSQVDADQFVLGLATALFMLASSNRLVRFVLLAAGTPAEVGERKISGGRLLGPMERLIVGATILAGDPAGAALVIAAKGLLRMPEIRGRAEQKGGKADEVTEYLLIGTFSSLLIAGALSVTVLAAG